jgi:hypothetical protein
MSAKSLKVFTPQDACAFGYPKSQPFSFSQLSLVFIFAPLWTRTLWATSMLRQK